MAKPEPTKDDLIEAANLVILHDGELAIQKIGSRLRELKAERDKFELAYLSTGKVLCRTAAERDALATALQTALDGGFWDHSVPCGFFKASGVCDCGLIEWKRTTRALLAKPDSAEPEGVAVTERIVERLKEVTDA